MSKIRNPQACAPFSRSCSPFRSRTLTLRHPIPLTYYLLLTSENSIEFAIRTNGRIDARDFLQLTNTGGH